ncbi:hypothetical protein [Sinobaca qinghaiensis]|nr:hypothetical protein [Sinobaca qinghaiensis]
MNKLSRLFFKASRTMGDAQAVRNGTIGKRLARRVLGRQAGKLIRKIIR